MTPKEFATAIRGSWQESTSAILQTADLYRAARCVLGDTGWTELLKDVPHSDSTARKLSLIGDWWAKTPLTSDLLPPHWGTLYALSRVPDDVARTAASQGKIHPGMERKDAEALVPKTAGNVTKAAQQAQGATVTQPVLQSNGTFDQQATLTRAVDMLLALKDASQPSTYANEVPRTKLALALAFMTSVHKLAK